MTQALRIWIARLMRRQERVGSVARADRTAFRCQLEGLDPRRLLTVTYHGGALLSHVEVQPVYLGSDWNSAAALQTRRAQLENYVSTIVDSQYVHIFTNAGYGVGRGTANTGAVDNIAVNKATGITDAQIRGEVQAMVNRGMLQPPDANRLYEVFVEPGVRIHAPFGDSKSNFLSYHGAFAGTDASGRPADIRYTVTAYPGDPNNTPDSQGFASDFDMLTSVGSHELAEAVTDPDVNYKPSGWYDDQANGEIADLTRQTTNLNGYVVPNVVDQHDHVIGPSFLAPLIRSRLSGDGTLRFDLRSDGRLFVLTRTAAETFDPAISRLLDVGVSAFDMAGNGDLIVLETSGRLYEFARSAAGSFDPGAYKEI